MKQFLLIDLLSDKKELFDVIDDVLQDCYNDLYEYSDESLTLEKADLIYNNVELFTKKLKDKIEEETNIPLF